MANFDRGGWKMNMIHTIKLSSFLISLFSLFMVFGCAHYEVNTGRGGIPGYYIRYEMQEADRAVEAARQAGKDRTCPAAFKDAEETKNRAYDVFRACHTEEGVALAKQATAKANALCPPAAEAVKVIKQEEAVKVLQVPAAEPTPGHYKYCITLHIEFDIDQAIIRPEYRDEVA